MRFSIFFHALQEETRRYSRVFLCGRFRLGLSLLSIRFLFSLRFLYEFLKENQEAFEDNLVLNMGQILSIIPVIIGFYLFFNAKKLLNENS